MITRDEFGIIVDNGNRDGGDSANRSGLTALFGWDENLNWFFWGLLCRHPTQKPWSNEKNFSRDQLIPFAAGLWRQEAYWMARWTFDCHKRRLFFAQNSERDKPGSTKFPWPHRFINDRGEPEFRWFDFADPLPPDAIWHLILCGKVRTWYWFGVIGYPWLVAAIICHGLFSSSNDEGQIISQAVVAGPWFVRLYKRFAPDWRDRLDAYWGGWRDQPEIAELIKRELEEGYK